MGNSTVQKDSCTVLYLKGKYRIDVEGGGGVSS